MRPLKLKMQAFGSYGREHRAYDEAGPIGGGTHERFLIMNERFLAKAQNRGGN